MKLVLINVGISRGYRGVIFPDRSFVFVPLNSKSGWCKKMPLYEDLRVVDYTSSKHLAKPFLSDSSLADLLPRLRGKRAHNDPDFEHMTYGHKKRGFGYEPLLLSLDEGDILLCLATLDYYPIEDVRQEKIINPNWGAYIVGALVVDAVYTQEKFFALSVRKQQRFKHNPHYYCDDPADIWVAGKQGEYGLFRKAVPLSLPDSSLECQSLLSENFTSMMGKKAGSAGWYRAALVCKSRTKRVWSRICTLGEVPISG